VGLFVQSAFGANTIYNLFRNNLHALRNVVFRDRVPYEQGIHVFAQPVMGPAGTLAGYSLAVTGTTSLAFSKGVQEFLRLEQMVTPILVGRSWHCND